MKSLQIYMAFDGSRFDDAEACKAHEAEHAESRLVGLTIEQIKAALARSDVDLADAFEDIGAKIARTRRASGEMRRQAKGAVRETEAAPEKSSGLGEPLAAGETAAADATETPGESDAGTADADTPDDEPSPATPD